MSIRRHARTLLVLAFLLPGFSRLQATPLKSQKTQETPEVLLAQAATAERNQEWEKALENYLKGFLAGRQTPEVRERIRVCQQRLAQAQRHRDSALQEYLTSLPAADAFNLYSEVLDRLNVLYVDREKVRPEQLFRTSWEELDRALQSPTFRRLHLGTATDSQIAAARKHLQDFCSTKTPKTIREMRTTTQQLVRTLQSKLEITNASVVVFELLCGASNSLDEHSLYLSQFQTAMTTDSMMLETVQDVSMLSMKDGVGYIKVTAFTDRTPGELDDAIQQLRDQGLRSLVLDLRGNAGGNFLAGVQVARRFLSSGIIVSTQSRVSEFSNRVFSSESGMMALDVPMVLLVDSKTMSSAEIVASALKEQNRATVIGMPTFGKGVVQYPFKLSAADVPEMEGSMQQSRSGTLVITIAKVLTARGTPIHGQGVLPDVVESDNNRQIAIALERAIALARMR